MKHNINLTIYKKSNSIYKFIYSSAYNQADNNVGIQFYFFFYKSIIIPEIFLIMESFMRPQ